MQNRSTNSHDKTATPEKLHASLHNLLDLVVLVLLSMPTAPSTTVMLRVAAAMLRLTWITAAVSVRRLTPIIIPAARWRRHVMDLSTSKIDEDSAFIVLRLEAQSLSLEHSLSLWLNFLHVALRVNAFAHNHMEV